MTHPPEAGPGQVRRIRLRGGHIVGKLELQYAKIETPISLIDCRFDEPVDLSEAAIRAIDFTGCRMPSFQAHGLRVDADLVLSGVSTDRISLMRAVITGNLWLVGAQVKTPGHDWAINAAQLSVGGGIYANSLRATGGINLWGARAFALELRAACLSANSRPALRGDGLSLAQDFHASGLVVTSGGIRLFGASVGGQLWFAEANVSGSTTWAIDAPMLHIAGGLYGRALTAEGGLNLFKAVVGESVELPKTTLLAAKTMALRASGIDIGGGLMLNDGTRIEGDIDLSYARVKGLLTLSTAMLVNDTAILLRGAAAETLDVCTLNAKKATLDLVQAHVVAIHDDANSWPHRVALAGLTYEALDPALPARHRLAWLSRGEGYHPQPYEQLAKHYRQLGQDGDTRTVLLAKQRGHRRTLRLPFRCWGYLEDLITGYGYRPMRALLWLLAFAAIAAAVFGANPPRPAQATHPSFQPVIYAFDLILPILDLGQERAFIPIGYSRWVAWLCIIAGWLLATTAIAGITRRLVKT